MLMLKEGVELNRMSPQILIGLMIVNDVLDVANYPCIVTSINDGRHSARSLHYRGDAVDVRTKIIPTDKEKIKLLVEIRKRAGKNFDVVFESSGTINEHIHIEYDPKPKDRSA